jgi:hypothetical protein
MECLSCYKNACDFLPNCMDLISTEMVEKAVLRQLAISQSPDALTIRATPKRFQMIVAN